MESKALNTYNNPSKIYLRFKEYALVTGKSKR